MNPHTVRAWNVWKMPIPENFWVRKISSRHVSYGGSRDVVGPQNRHMTNLAVGNASVSPGRRYSLAIGRIRASNPPNTPLLYRNPK